MKEDIIIVDTETTGLLEVSSCSLEFQPHMIEIFVLRVNSKLKPVGEFSSLIQVPVPVPSFITRITGVSDIDLQKAPTFKKIYKSLNKIFKGTSLMVAHNATFDYNIIKNEFERIEKQCFLPNSLYCTVEQSLHFFGYRMKNLELYEKLTGKKEIKNQHRAKADVLATFDNYKELIKLC